MTPGNAAQPRDFSSRLYRRSERFVVSEPATLVLSSEISNCRIRNVSMDGLGITTSAVMEPGDEGTVISDRLGRLPCRLVHKENELLGLKILLPEEGRASLIREVSRLCTRQGS